MSMNKNEELFNYVIKTLKNSKIFTEKKVFQRSLQFSGLWFRIDVRDGERKQGKPTTFWEGCTNDILEEIYDIFVRINETVR